MFNLCYKNADKKDTISLLTINDRLMRYFRSFGQIKCPSRHKSTETLILHYNLRLLIASQCIIRQQLKLTTRETNAGTWIICQQQYHCATAAKQLPITVRLFAAKKNNFKIKSLKIFLQTFFSKWSL